MYSGVGYAGTESRNVRAGVVKSRVVGKYFYAIFLNKKCD